MDRILNNSRVAKIPAAAGWPHYRIQEDSPSFSIYLVLTHPKSLIATAVRFLKRDSYTHAAICMDGRLQTLYGFGRKWAKFPFFGCFRKENLSKGFYAGQGSVPGLVLRLDISKEQYEAVAQMIEHFVRNSSFYRYNILGMLGNIISTPVQRSGRFTCSEFVAYVLERCGIMTFSYPLSLIRPQMLSQISAQIVYQGDLKKFAAAEPQAC